MKKTVQQLKISDLVVVNNRPGIIVAEPDKEHWTVKYKTKENKLVRTNFNKSEVVIREPTFKES